MSNRAANILIGILGVLLLLGLTLVLANSVKPTVTTTTVFTLTTIPRSNVQVKVTTTTRFIPKHVTPNATPSEYPYEALCDLALTHPDPWSFIENLFFWAYENTEGAETDRYYDATSQAIIDIMERKHLCKNALAQDLIEATRPYVYAEGGH